jgi:hypothetical protein
MSWQETITLWCDGNGCAEQITTGPASVTEARRKAQGQGWAVIYGTMDLCQFHNEHGPTVKRVRDERADAASVRSSDAG